LTGICFKDTAYAKINLALHVRRRRSDGYHELETLFAFASDGDLISVEPDGELSLSITGRFAEGLSAGEDNLVLRAARLLQQRTGVRKGAAFKLEKRLPVASGIGGGSADAAAALRLACRLWEIDAASVLTADLGAALGADVPACILSQSCLGSGVGEHLLPFEGPGLAGRPILLVNPMIACPTGPVFQAWDGIDRGSLDPEKWIDGRNDLQSPAIAVHPVIADVLARLHATGAEVVRMSGSGATCFALYSSADARDAAQRAIAKACRHWWTMASLLR